MSEKNGARWGREGPQGHLYVPFTMVNEPKMGLSARGSIWTRRECPHNPSGLLQSLIVGRQVILMRDFWLKIGILGYVGPNVASAVLPTCSGGENKQFNFFKKDRSTNFPHGVYLNRIRLAAKTI